MMSHSRVAMASVNGRGHGSGNYAASLVLPIIGGYTSRSTVPPGCRGALPLTKQVEECRVSRAD